jgi:hypothetical protein
MGEDTYFWLGASADAETGSREPNRRPRTQAKRLPPRKPDAPLPVRSGLDCKRVPLSGAGDEKGDLRLVTGWGQTLKGECKSRGELAKWIVNALGEHDFLVLKQDRGETLVMLRLELFRDLCQ